MPRVSHAELAEIAERRKRVAEMYLSRKTQAEIGVIVGKDQKTISNDLKVIRAEWLASSLMDFNTRQAEELARIDWIEKEARQAWERSKAVAVEVTCETVPVKTKTKKKGKAEAGEQEPAETTKTVRTTRKERHRDGDESYLARISWCVEQRCKILGIPSQAPPPPAAPVVVVMSPAVLAAALALDEALANDRKNSATRPNTLGAGTTGSPDLPMGPTPPNHSSGSDETLDGNAAPPIG